MICRWLYGIYRQFNNIPNSVTSIGTVHSSGCTGFTGSLTIPDSVTSIGNAFKGAGLLVV